MEAPRQSRPLDLSVPDMILQDSGDEADTSHFSQQEDSQLCLSAAESEDLSDEAPEPLRGESPASPPEAMEPVELDTAAALLSPTPFHASSLSSQELPSYKLLLRENQVLYDLLLQADRASLLSGGGIHSPPSHTEVAKLRFLLISTAQENARLRQALAQRKPVLPRFIAEREARTRSKIADITQRVEQMTAKGRGGELLEMKRKYLQVSKKATQTFKMVNKLRTAAARHSVGLGDIEASLQRLSEDGKQLQAVVRDKEEVSAENVTLRSQLARHQTALEAAHREFGVRVNVLRRSILRRDERLAAERQQWRAETEIARFESEDFRSELREKQLQHKSEMGYLETLFRAAIAEKVGETRALEHETDLERGRTRELQKQLSDMQLQLEEARAARETLAKELGSRFANVYASQAHAEETVLAMEKELEGARNALGAVSHENEQLREALQACVHLISLPAKEAGAVMQNVLLPFFTQANIPM